MRAVISYVDIRARQVGVSPPDFQDQTWDIVGHVLNTNTMHISDPPQGSIRSLGGRTLVVPIKHSQTRITLNTKWPFMFVDWDKRELLLVPHNLMWSMCAKTLVFPAQHDRILHMESWVRAQKTHPDGAENFRLRPLRLSVRIRRPTGSVQPPVKFKAVAHAVFRKDLSSPYQAVLRRSWYQRLGVALGVDGQFYRAKNGLLTSRIGPNFCAAEMRQVTAEHRLRYCVVDESTYAASFGGGQQHLYISWQDGKDAEEMYAMIEISASEMAFLCRGGHIDEHPRLLAKILLAQEEKRQMQK